MSAKTNYRIHKDARMILSMEEIQHVATILIVLQLFGWMQHVMEKKLPPPKKKGTLPPIIMVQWKIDVSPILVSFHLFPLP